MAAPTRFAQAQPAAALLDATLLEPVVVTGSLSARRLADAPYATDVLDAETIKNSGPMVNLSEALVRVPGLSVANRNNFAQDLQISSRGFGARAGFGVRGMRLFTDGIPATMPDGQGQVSHFDLAGAQRIEVLRGPFSALYGGSSGGVIALFTAPARQGRMAFDVDAGSFGLRQQRVSAALPLGNGWDAQAQFSHLVFQGFRPHSEAVKDLGNFRLGWQGERDRMVLTGSDLVQQAEDPLGLTRAQMSANARQTAPEAVLYDTRKTARQTQIGGRWEHTFDFDTGLAQSSVTAYRGSRGVTQWQAIPIAAQTPAASGGGVVDFDRIYQGVDARLSWHWAAVDIVTGSTLETQTDQRQGFENFNGVPPKLGVTGALRRDETDTVQTRDVYAQAEIQLASTVSATLGARSGQVRYGVDDRFVANGNDSGALRFNYTTPVAGLRWRPAAGWTVYASAARGFESPTQVELAYPPAGGAGFNTLLKPQTSRQFEAGTRWSHAVTSVQATVFHIDSQNEIGVATNSGGRATYQNVGGTRRMGAELGVQAALAPGIKAQLALTWLSAVYQDAFRTCTATPCSANAVAGSAVVPAGNAIAGTAKSSVYAELAWQPWRGQAAQFALEAQGRARTAVNDVNSDFAAGWGELALRATQRWHLDGQGVSPATAAQGDRGAVLELLARVDNLTQRRHAGSVIVNDGNARYFEPAAPRSALLSVRLRYGW